MRLMNEGVRATATGERNDARQVPVVRLAHVSKRFSNGTLALEDFTFAFPQHGFVSLLGPSGCGKSTILKLIAGLNEPTSGAIQWMGGQSQQRDGRRDIAFVFQEPTLLPWANALRNVMIPLILSRVPWAEAKSRALEALEQVGLAGFESSYPRELSGGMKMRVSIARAIVERPRVLLMDEPFAALDEITRFKMNQDLLKLWQAHEFTVLFVTHSVYEATYLSQHVLIMAPRPGRAYARVAVEAPYPRDEGFRGEPLYHERCAEISALLAETSHG